MARPIAKTSQTAVPFLIACAGLASFSAMDAVMKGLSLAIGAYNAVFWRCLFGCAISGAAFVLTRAAWPGRAALAIHVWRGMVVSVVAVLFFWAIARLPLAEAIALTFVSPLLALYLAAILLGERIGRDAIVASLLGVAGVGVILAGRFGDGEWPADAPLAVAALFGSALLFAYNLILARRQALIAKPLEIAFFQSLVMAACLGLAAPLLAVLPGAEHAPALAGAAVLTIVSLLLLSWAYARAEAQVLIPVEYTGFVWAALLGWWFFDEALTLPVVVGAALIVAGSLIAARRSGQSGPHVEQAAV